MLLAPVMFIAALFTQEGRADYDPTRSLDPVKAEVVQTRQISTCGGEVVDFAYALDDRGRVELTLLSIDGANLSAADFSRVGEAMRAYAWVTSSQVRCDGVGIYLRVAGMGADAWYRYVEMDGLPLPPERVTRIWIENGQLVRVSPESGQ